MCCHASILWKNIIIHTHFCVFHILNWQGSKLFGNTVIQTWASLMWSQYHDKIFMCSKQHPMAGQNTQPGSNTYNTEIKPPCYCTAPPQSKFMFDKLLNLIKTDHPHNQIRRISLKLIRSDETIVSVYTSSW